MKGNKTSYKVLFEITYNLVCFIVGISHSVAVKSRTVDFTE